MIVLVITSYKLQVIVISVPQKFSRTLPVTSYKFGIVPSEFLKKEKKIIFKVRCRQGRNST